MVALYEIVPEEQDAGGELGVTRISYRSGQDTALRVMQKEIGGSRQIFAAAPDDFRFAASVALFGMLVKNSAYKGTGNIDMVTGIAKKALGPDKGGYRMEFLKLIKLVKKNTAWLK